eukprot:gnl/MRDRNA2_/MRDRNA2_85741_c1_seq4.p2 gnl/MRDRNA2_/MRDRNA2_85741_c1~~gnl/MRDRNA2_/MRDRNA2_85741_c1_seq4.p2  ORF type:complete len:129 (-),score=4.91 gnl/MRDRNA2_/MRDRNA2_85741_c1_seq4:211-597(-)
MIMKVVLLLQLFCHAPSLRRIPIKEDSSQRNDLPVRANSKPDFSGRFFNTTAIIWPDELKNVEATFHNEDTFGLETATRVWSTWVGTDPCTPDPCGCFQSKRIFIVKCCFHIFQFIRPYDCSGVKKPS